MKASSMPAGVVSLTVTSYYSQRKYRGGHYLHAACRERHGRLLVWFGVHPN